MSSINEITGTDGKGNVVKVKRYVGVSIEHSAHSLEGCPPLPKVLDAKLKAWQQPCDAGEARVNKLTDAEAHREWLQQRQAVADAVANGKPVPDLGRFWTLEERTSAKREESTCIRAGLEALNKKNRPLVLEAMAHRADFLRGKIQHMKAAEQAKAKLWGLPFEKSAELELAEALLHRLTQPLGDFVSYTHSPKRLLAGIVDFK